MPEKTERHTSRQRVPTTGQQKKAVSDAMKAKRERNRKKVSKNELTCKYFPYFCKVTGHSNANTKACGMFGKSKAEKLEAENEIETKLIQEYVEKNSLGKIFYIHIVTTTVLVYFLNPVF